VVVTTCGELAGFTIPAVVGAAATSAGLGQSASMVLLVLAGVGEGSVLGWAQSRMLRRELPALRTGDWVRATAAGAGVAWSIGMLPSTFSQQFFQLWPPMLVAVGILAGVLLLATIGVAQWLVLRRHIARSGSWVLANALAWIAGLAVVFTVIAVAPPDAPVLMAVFGVAGGLGMGLTVALVTGLFLVRLLNRVRPAVDMTHLAAPTAAAVGSGPVAAGDDVGDRLDDLGQRPLQGAGEAVARGQRSGGDAHEHDRGREAVEGLGQASQRLRVEVMRPGRRGGRTWLDPPDQERTRVAVGGGVDEHDQRRLADVGGELRDELVLGQDPGPGQARVGR
jgi:hypothetical protein